MPATTGSRPRSKINTAPANLAGGPICIRHFIMSRPPPPHTREIVFCAKEVERESFKYLHPPERRRLVKFSYSDGCSRCALNGGFSSLFLYSFRSSSYIRLKAHPLTFTVNLASFLTRTSLHPLFSLRSEITLDSNGSPRLFCSPFQPPASPASGCLLFSRLFSPALPVDVGTSLPPRLPRAAFL